MHAYVAVMHKDENSEYGLSFPDFPGCIGAGVTAQAAVADAFEALTGPIELLLEEGQPVPEPSSVDEVLASGEANDGTLVIVHCPRVSGKSVRVNITLPDDDLAQIDRFCAQNYLTRSGFILSSCRIVMGQDDVRGVVHSGEPVEGDNNVVSLHQASNATSKGGRS